MTSPLSDSNVSELKSAYESKARAETIIRKNMITVPIPSIIDYTHAGNADWFVRMHGHKVKYVRDWERFMVWNGRVWEQFKLDELTPLVIQVTIDMQNLADRAGDDGRKLKAHAKLTQNTPNVLNTLRQTKNDHRIQAYPDDFDNQQYLLNFSNGTLDLLTGELRDFRREDMMTKCSKIPFYPDMPYPRFEKFIKETFGGDREMIKYIQTLFGMCMTGDVSQEQAFIFWGPTANNGKTTLVEIMGYILDEYFVSLNSSVISVGSKNSRETAIALVKGARLLNINEPSDNEPFDSALFKLFADKTQLQGRQLYGAGFRFTPTHHLIITTNPYITMKRDRGTDRREVAVPFEYSPKIIDKHLLEKLKTEAPQIISWMLEGCLRWQTEGLIQPKKVKDTGDECKAEMDHLREFWESCIIIEKYAETPIKEIYLIYKLWCEAYEIPFQSPKGFTQTIRRKCIDGVEVKQGYEYSSGQKRRARTYTGIKGTDRATEIARRVLNNPAERNWAIEQFQLSDSWSPDIDPYSIELMTWFGDNLPCITEGVHHLQDVFPSAPEHEIEDAVIAYLLPKKTVDIDKSTNPISVLMSGDSQRAEMKKICDIIRLLQNMNNGSADFVNILTFAEIAGMTPRVAEDRLVHLKSAGDIIEVGEKKYRII
jgi:putative DNA primase/helicase